MSHRVSSGSVGFTTLALQRWLYNFGSATLAFGFFFWFFLLIFFFFSFGFGFGLCRVFLSGWVFLCVWLCVLYR
jgi:hypothetical protein